MQLYRVPVQIIPRPGILDPQGAAVAGALRSLGFNTIADIRVGRFITVDVNAASATDATSAVRSMCEKLLANPVIEDFVLEEPSAATGRSVVKFGIVTFPGSNGDYDAYHAAADALGEESVYLWHKDHDLKGCDVIVLPGGFSYGDYLRPGAIARFSPIMNEVVAHAKRGAPVLAICNGFQVACEAGLLPGALLRNASLRFVSRVVTMRVENAVQHVHA